MTEHQKFTFNRAKQIQQEIETCFDATTFVLNPKIEQLHKELDELQEKCDHEFENNHCKYCGKE
jgi:hypothetical protein